MKILKVTTDNVITEHDFPEGDIRKANRILRSLIGDMCQIYEHVRPRRLYESLGHAVDPYEEKPGVTLSMLIDENGLLDGLPENPLGSWLYETDKHGYPIVGNILIIGEKMTEDGIEFCGIVPEKLEELKTQIEAVFEIMKEIKETENET